MMLEVRDLVAGYGAVTVLHGIDVFVGEREVLCLMGRNGTGKTTLLRAIMGLVPARRGEVRLSGTRIDVLRPHLVPRAGVGYVPQGRRLFAPLTVSENIEIGLRTRGHGPETRERVLGLFPRLRDRLSQTAGTLSGGEQQMLAIARALCVEPTLLLLDEPTEGLQPSMVALIRETIARLRSEGMATLLVEQRVDTALAVADRIAFVAAGRIAETAATADLTPDAPQFRNHVGV